MMNYKSWLLAGISSSVMAAVFVYISRPGAATGAPAAAVSLPLVLPAAPAIPEAEPSRGREPESFETLREFEIIEDAPSELLLAAIEAGDAGIVSSALDRYLPRWMADDPAKVAEWLVEADLGANRALVLGAVARLWARSDPSRAMQWTEENTDQAEREALMGCVCLAWAESMPAKALAFAEGNLTKERSLVITNIIANWAERDLPAASSWALSRPRDVLRDALIQEVAMREAGGYPREAAALVLEEIPPGETQTEAAISVLHQWAQRDMAAAKSWVDGFPAGSVMKKRAQQELANLNRYR